jgi:hypothetical protein
VSRELGEKFQAIYFTPEEHTVGLPETLGNENSRAADQATERRHPLFTDYLPRKGSTHLGISRAFP